MALLFTDVSMARLTNDEERRLLISKNHSNDMDASVGCDNIYGCCLLLVCSFKVLVLTLLTENNTKVAEIKN